MGIICLLKSTRYLASFRNNSPCKFGIWGPDPNNGENGVELGRAIKMVPFESILLVSYQLAIVTEARALSNRFRTTQQRHIETDRQAELREITMPNIPPKHLRPNANRIIIVVYRNPQKCTGFRSDTNSQITILLGTVRGTYWKSTNILQWKERSTWWFVHWRLSYMIVPTPQLTDLTKRTPR